MATASVDFPLGGLNLGAAYQKQPAGTAARAQNVRATDTFARRH